WFEIGDVDGMVTAAMSYESRQNANVCHPWAIMRRGIERGRGGEADVVVVLGTALDDDVDKGVRLDFSKVPAPSLIIESSAGNRHPTFLFDKALAPAEAKKLLAALHTATNGAK